MTKFNDDRTIHNFHHSIIVRSTTINLGQGDSISITNSGHLFDFGEDAIGQWIVDTQHHHRIAAHDFATDLHTGNVDIKLAQERTNDPDNSTLILAIELCFDLGYN